MVGSKNQTMIRICSGAELGVGERREKHIQGNTFLTVVTRVADPDSDPYLAKSQISIRIRISTIIGF